MRKAGENLELTPEIYIVSLCGKMAEAQTHGDSYFYLPLWKGKHLPSY